MNTRFSISPIRGKLMGAITLLALLAGPLCAQTPQIAAGDDFTVIIDASKNLYTYGSNGSGQLGIGDESATEGEVHLVEPQGVWRSVAVSKIAASSGAATGVGHVLAVRTDGTLWAWGANDRGQLGVGNTIDQSSPVQVIGLSSVAEVAAGSNFSMARTTSGQVFVWGDNTSGQLARSINPEEANGFGTPADAFGNPLNCILIPDLLDGNGYISIAAGLTSAVAIRVSAPGSLEGSLYAWGYSDSRQLGYNMSTASNNQKFRPTIVPHRIGSDSNWTEVFSGNTLSFALKGGALHTWGFALNRGTTSSNYDTPVRIGDASDWETVAIGENHTLALRNGGELWGWGNNGEGELGIEHNYAVSGWNQNFPPPTHLEVGTTFAAIGAGLDFSSIYTSDAFLLTSGVNDNGQLGNGTADSGDHYEFVPGVLGLTDLVAISLDVSSETLTAGGALEANVFFGNDGTGALTDDFELAAVLSQYPYYSEFGTISIPFTIGETVTADIVAGASISHAISLSIPSTIPVGSYYLILRADSGEVLSEVTRSNNDVVATDDEGENEVFDFLADLQIVSADISVDPNPDSNGSAFPLENGDPMNVTYTITNEGNGSLSASAADSFVQRVVLSETNSINAPSYINFVPDVPSELIESGGLAAGASITRTIRFTIPNNLGIGNFYLGVSVDDATDTVDDFGAIEESDEENNFAFTTTAVIEVTGIELEEALDTVLYTTPIDFSFTTSSEPGGLRSWFGQDITTYDTVDAARSPGLAEGQSATLTQAGFTAEAVSVTFRWKAETSNADNYLYFGLGEVEINSTNSRISGTTDWTEVTHIVPPNSQMTWTYVQTTDSTDDVVYIDTISVVSLAEPDLVINSVTGQTGSYILGADELQLRIAGANQGASTSVASGIPFNVGVYLSQDPNFNSGTDILIDSLPVSTVVEGGSPFLHIPVIDLDPTIPSGLYYLIVVADDGGTVDEGATGGEGNNIFVSDAADIEILALPDIRIASLSPNPGYYVVGGEDVKFGFSITNDGLQGVTDEFTVKIVLSTDNVPDSGDYEVASFPFAAGLPVGAVVSIQPDTYEIPSHVPLGQRLYFGVIVDSNNDIAEQKETNNAASYPDNDFVFSGVSINEAFDLGAASSMDDSTFYPFNGDLPWYGYSHDAATSPAFDLEDSIRSIEINDNETAALEFTVNALSDTFITFKWKVSSEHNDTLGKYDTLNFYVDDLANPIRSISGDVDWHTVSYKVSAGTHTVRWAYIKDSSESDGDDAGWLDSFTFENADLDLDQVSFTAGSYVPGATITDFAFTVENIGVANVPETPAFTISVVASNDTVFGNAGDNVLATYLDSDGLLSGESRDYLIDLLLPASLPAGDYYIGVKVDSLEIIPESSEINNLSFTVSPVLEIVPDISLNEALDDPDIAGPGELEFTLGGQQGWFSVADALLPDGTHSTSDTFDAAQSGPIEAGEESYFQTITAGPKELKFRWKVNSALNSNILKFTLNDQTIEQITGKVDWDYGFGGFTLSYQGEVTSPIGAGSSAAEFEAALNALSTITAAGGVSVVAGPGTVPLEYEITFVGVTNKDPISVVFIDAQKVNASASSLLTDSNGTASTSEVQTLTIVPSVSFRLSFDDQDTADLLYTATSAEVETALNLIVPGGVTVTGADLDFEVTFNDIGEQLAIEVDASGLDQPGTVDNEVTTLGNGGTNQVQEIRMGPEITVFIPAGTQELRWTYSKTTTGVDTLDAAWVDQIAFTDVLVPELVLTGLNYTAGEYVLDIAGISGEPNQLLGTEYLDITVEAENQGESVGQTSFTSADLEVRLSVDPIFGNADDILLGTVSQVEGDFDSGNLMRFLGPIQLGDSIPEDSYYLMAKVDSNDSVDEYDEANNIMISENRDVTITRLPALRIVNPNTSVVGEWSDGVSNFLDPQNGSVAFDIDEDLFYYSESPMRLRFAVQNIGLDRVEGSERWTVAVNLRGGLREDLTNAGDVDAVIDALDLSMELGDLTIQELLQGRSEANPTGDIIDLDLDLALPSGARLNELIAEGKTIEDYLWIIEVTLDSTNVVRESSIVTEAPLSIKPSGLPWWIFNPFEAYGDVTVPIAPSDYTVTNTNKEEGLFGISFQPGLINATAWEGLYGGAYLTADPEYFLAYAFNRNPADHDTALNQFPGTFGLTEFEGDNYLSIAFDLVTRATDLTYIVEAADELPINPGADGYTVLATIDGPYDQLTGTASLTGDGGLIDEDNVTNVLDQGYSARVTIKDTVDSATAPTRFIHVSVSSVDAEPVPEP